MKNHSTIHSRHSVRLSWLALGAASIAVGALIIAGAWALMRPAGTAETAMRSRCKQALRVEGRTLQVASRRTGGPVIYPYSIVAGGIHSLADLRHAIETDPVVAAHYAKFNLAKFRIVKLDKDEYAYVSYRIGSDVFWTKKQLKLCKGETLITDGQRFARARCGNQLSQVAEAETWSGEPPPAVLNAPARPALQAQADAFGAVVPPLDDSMPEGAPTGPVDLPASVSGETASASASPMPFIGPFSSVLPPADCGEKSPCISPPKPNRPPSTPVPEGSSLILLATGMAALAINYLLFKNRGPAKRRSSIPDL
jgi:hypothetical protein